MRRACALIAGVALVVFARPALAEPAGVYLSQSGETKVEFAKCGGSLCGTIVWTKSGQAIGKRMIFDVERTGDNQWQGKLWNYRDGKTYRGKLSLQGPNLKLSGCAVAGLICRSQVWTPTN